MTAEPEDAVSISIELNGQPVERTVAPSQTILDFVRELGCTGTHAGCEYGVCGACTVLLDGAPVRGCIVLAVQADGHRIETVESLGTADEPHPLQQAFSRRGALQCGYCTPGFLMLACGLLRAEPSPDEEQIRDAVSSNICRCTGYESIVAAVADVVAEKTETR